MQRIDPNRILLDERCGGVELFANEQVHVDRRSVDEAIAFLAVNDTIDKLRDIGFLSTDSRIDKIIYTPDFHKVSGIPVGTVFRSHGFVMPRAVGSDIGCGMRFMTTDVTRAEFDRLGDKLDQILRHIFFEGGRNIPLSAIQREYIFKAGLYGLLSVEHSDQGIWQYWHDDRQSHARMFVHEFGNLTTQTVFDLTGFINGSGGDYTHDDQIGSIGGGNHFCEFQVIEETFDRHLAYAYHLQPDTISIMCHSGSLGIGHQIGNHFTDLARDLYPADLRHEHDFYVLPVEEWAPRYISAMSNAGNFAFANRLFLGLMMVRALSEALGRRIDHRLVYDAPHNLIWDNEEDGYLHRKGACPADQDEIVIIPGSMGSSSYLMVGQGNDLSLSSCCHGAGRTKPRQQGRKGAVANPCRVVTKIDPRRVRADIRDEHARALAEEAPDKYKPIDPIIETVEGAGIARRVARMFPLLTVKGL